MVDTVCAAARDIAVNHFAVTPLSHLFMLLRIHAAVSLRYNPDDVATGLVRQYIIDAATLDRC